MIGLGLSYALVFRNATPVLLIIQKHLHLIHTAKVSKGVCKNNVYTENNETLNKILCILKGSQKMLSK